MGMIWRDKPKVSDQILIWNYAITGFLFFSGLAFSALSQYENYHKSTIVIAGLIASFPLLSMSLITIQNILLGRTIGQSKSYTKKIGINRVANIPILQGLKNNMVWGIFPIVVIAYGAMSWIWFLALGYIFECFLFDLEFKFFYSFK